MARFITLYGEDIALPRGVDVVKNRRGEYSAVRIIFQYRGRRHTETLPGGVSARVIEQAGIKRAAILLEISEGRFDYRSYFPDSRQVLAVAGIADARINATLSDMLEEEKQIARETKAPSTVKAELPRHLHITKFLGPDTQVRYITVEDIKRFQRHMKMTWSAKTANNAMIPLRAILLRAYQRKIITESLHDRVRNLPADETRPQKEVQPLTLDELDKFAGVETTRIADRDMYLFNAWTGLSISELMALAWEDLDTRADVWRLHVRRARVSGIWKVTKERSRNREIELNARAQAYLKAQRARTQVYPPIDIEVLQRDNMTRVAETIRPVFRNTRSGLPWNDKSLDRCFRFFCRAAGIPVRGPNQTRHTFASRMLTLGLPMHVLTQLMGHASEAMILRHYGQWIGADLEGKVAQMMNQAINTLNGAN